MKNIIAISIICAGITCSCQQKSSKKEAKDSAKTTDTVEQTVQEENKVVATPSTKTIKKIPIDSTITSFPNGRKAKLYIYSYHDTIPGKPIKDFAIIDDKDSTLLAFDGEPYIFKEEGLNFDEHLNIAPCFFISDSIELKLDLCFYYDFKLETFRNLFTIPFTNVFKARNVKNKSFHNFLSFHLDTFQNELEVQEALLTKLYDPQFSNTDSIIEKYETLEKASYYHEFEDIIIINIKERNNKHLIPLINFMKTHEDDRFNIYNLYLKYQYYDIKNATLN